MKLGRLIGVAGTSAMIIAGTMLGESEAAASPEVVVNGILSTIGGCQSTSTELIRACTDLEILSPQAPLMLVFNPFTTNIVVLGAGLYNDGSIRPVLESRLQAALTLAQEFPFAPIIVSGGVPRSGVTEAQAMSNWLVGAGIPEWRITQEDTSHDTIGNAKNTAEILARRGAPGAVVVTSPDHLRRAMLNFRIAVQGRIPIEGVISQ